MRPAAPARPRPAPPRCSAMPKSLLCSVSSSILHRGRSQHLAAAIAAHLADHSGQLHGLDQPRGSIVANAQSALHRGDGGPPALGDDAHRLVVEFVFLAGTAADQKSTRLNSSHVAISYAVFCLKKKNES